MKESHIEICGGISSGKTTLAALLGHNGYTPVLEQFNKHPFLEAFYKDPIKFSFETEITFLLQHYHDIKVKKEECTSIICDFSLTLDRAFADVTLPKNKQKLFSTLADEIEHEIGSPTKVIYLKCSEEILIQRIRKRDRFFEKSITIDYLRDLNKALERRLNLLPKDINLIEIDSNKTDFQNCSDHKSFIIQEIIK